MYNVYKADKILEEERKKVEREHNELKMKKIKDSTTIT